MQKKSKVTLTINGAAGAGGSTISFYSITGGGLSYTESSVTTGFLNTSGSITFTGKVCDSRGRWSDEVSVAIEVVPYAASRFNNYSTQRCTVTSLKNLITMVYSRGPLLSKATGGSFTCSAELISGLKDCKTVEDVVESLSPDLAGLSVADDKINFVFPATDDADKVQAFTQLAAQMNKAAKNQKRVVPKIVDATGSMLIQILIGAIPVIGAFFIGLRKKIFKKKDDDTISAESQITEEPAAKEAIANDGFEDIDDD